MAFFFALIQLVTACIVVLYELYIKSTGVFLWGMLIMVFSFPHFIEVALKSGGPELNTASIFAIVFNITYLCIHILLCQNKEQISLLSNGKPSNFDKRLTLFLILTLSLSVILACYQGILISGSLLNTSWYSFLNENHGYFSFILYANVIYMASSGILLYGLIKRSKKITFIALLGTGIYFLITRNRSIILPALCSFLATLIYKGNIRALTYLKLFGAGMGILICVELLQFFKLAGTVDNFFYLIHTQSITEYVLGRLSGGGEVGLRNMFYYFIRENNNFEGFGEGRTYLRMLFGFIPGGLLNSLKPEDFAATIAKAVNGGSSAHPTLYGDCYANFGFGGCLMGSFWAFFVAASDLLCRRKNIIIKCMLISANAYYLVLVGRGSVSYMFGFLLWAYVILGVLYCTSRAKWGNKKNYEQRL